MYSDADIGFTSLQQAIVDYLHEVCEYRFELMILYLIAYLSRPEPEAGISISHSDLWTKLKPYVRGEEYYGRPHWLKTSLSKLQAAGLIQRIDISGSDSRYIFAVPETPRFEVDLTTLREILLEQHTAVGWLGLKDWLAPLSSRLPDEKWLEEGPERCALVVCP